MLRCALTFREASSRRERVPDEYRDLEHAIDTMRSVLLHEARESMQDPLSESPPHPFMHPVDVDTDDPGIVDQKDDLHIVRCDPGVPRVSYDMPSDVRAEPPPMAVFDVDRDRAVREASKALASTLKRTQREEGVKEARRQARRERAKETPNTKARRLSEARERAAERKQKRESAAPRPPRAPSAPAPPPSAECIACPDACGPLVRREPRRLVARAERKGVHFFSHPLPHHRHLDALRSTRPDASLVPALLRGESVPGVLLVHGPPGTGKTRELVCMAKRARGRVLLCAPTNVGAANLYTRCIAEGLSDASLALAPERVPLGTPVLCNDPSRRVVCATVSARAGGALHGQAFESVFVDEAAQCMEAWVWGLLREEVRQLVLAGDVHQLPACVSETGSDLHHGRSLMERLHACGYANARELTVQNRMAPEVLRFPNDAFYGGRLSSGPHAPIKGRVSWHETEGHEESDGTSQTNAAEAEEAVRVAIEMTEELGPSVVLVSPYAAQCRLLLSKKTGLEVHTVDSFQGREADGVVLSCVRDGSKGMGFWDDERRLTVALTRARFHLAIVSTPRAWPPSSPLFALQSALSSSGAASSSS